jgi:hypothetical protein
MHVISPEIFKKNTSWEVQTEIRMKIGIKRDLLRNCMRIVELGKIIRVQWRVSVPSVTRLCVPYK